MDKFEKNIKNLNGEVSMNKNKPNFHEALWRWKLNRVLVFTLLFSAFLLPGWHNAKNADAAISAVTPWAHPSTGTTGPYTITNASFSCGAGPNRLLVAVITAEAASNMTMNGGITATKGTGVNFVQAVGNASSARGVWIGYLKESQINGNTNNIVITNSTGVAWARSDVYLACYSGVDQTNPISGTAQVVAAANVTGLSFNNVAAVNTGMMIYGGAVNSSTNPVTPPTGYTEAFDYASGAAYKSTMGYKAVTATGNESGTISWTTSERGAIAVAGINPVLCTETATIAITGPVPNPLSLPVSISATLGGSGGSNAQVSTDNATWQTSPWTYSPPGPGQTGSVTFYARADGFCGNKIYDATPVTVNYDTTFPTVQSTTPANGATGVALNSTVTINWSENIDCATVNTTNVTISPATGWTRTSCSGSQAVFTPSGQTGYTSYTIRVWTGVKDSTGMNMAANYDFSYTTVAPAPTVTSASPSSGRQEERLDVSIGGTNFLVGATADFGAGITVNSTTFVNASQLTANITIATAASTGVRTLRVTNPDGQFATRASAFTVNAGACIRNAPEVAVASSGTLDTGSSRTYGFSIKNNDTSFCSNSTFAMAISSETGNTGSFVLPSVLGSTTTGLLAPGAVYNTSLTVKAAASATVGHTLTTNVSVTDNTNHSGKAGSSSTTTKIVLWINDNLLHNSTNMTTFGSTKNYWSVEGGWGIPNGVYGGFTCETCHTKSETTNIKRVKQTITVPDTSKGNIPGSAVNLQSTAGTVNGFGDDQSTHATSTRICEICHTKPGKHKYNQSTDPLHENVVSTPANYQDCITCHEHKKGFVTPGCLDCHAKQQGSRAPVVGQFSSNSHHIQGVALSNTHCYECHWEANANGSINYTYHLGWRNGLAATPGSAVNLVIYGSTARPTIAYSEGVNGVAYTASLQTRAELGKINTHCLGCHDDDSASITPFGDGKTPKQYAWDGNSVATRYSQTGTAPWGKYSGANFTPKNTQTKAYSAHGNATGNQRGWNLTETWPNTANGTQNVVCFDCHNSHGSSVAGTTTSYAAGAGVTNGGILKDVTSGLGGSLATYKPAASDGTGNRTAHEAGAGLCFDCHMTQNAGTTPWGYQGTFGATQMIISYLEKPGWKGAAGVNPAGAQQRYAYKNNRPVVGGHFGASSALGSQVMGTIGGLCTPCHDPHGVSPTHVGTCSDTMKFTKSDCDSVSGTWTSAQAYGVPLLKGTWMTSIYKEDAAPTPTNQARGGGRRLNELNVGSTPLYRIDQNTFAALPTSSPWTWNFNLTTKITQPATLFAGLCLQCHPQSSINPDGGSGNKNTAWLGYDRIHNTVQGWGGQGANANNAMHAFTCSKCHTPHSSALPRLMITNCLDFSHRGQVVSGGTVRTGTNAYTGQQAGGDGRGHGRFPAGGGGFGDQPRGWNSNGGAYFFGIAGTSRTTYPAFRNCHDVPNGGTWPNNQQWNSKTPW